LQEVKILVEDWITVWWKTIRETKETENLAELTKFIWEFFEENKDLNKKEFLNKLKKL